MPSPVARDHQQTWGLGATPSYDRVRPPGAPESPQLSTPLADAVRRASRPPADDGMSSSNSATTETRTRVSLGELLTSSGSTRSSLFERGRRVVRGRGARRGAAAPFRRRAATGTRKVVSRGASLASKGRRAGPRTPCSPRTSRKSASTSTATSSTPRRSRTTAGIRAEAKTRPFCAPRVACVVRASPSELLATSRSTSPRGGSSEDVSRRRRGLPRESFEDVSRPCRGCRVDCSWTCRGHAAAAT